jgi:uncharacterized protein YigA (DUF484 family)
MSETQPGSPITADAVADYLAEHPDFLHDHPDLLAELLIPHATGSAVSLIERQVQVLRDKHAIAQRQLHQLIEVARDNDRLAERMHQLALALLDCTTLADVIGAVDAKLSGALRCCCSTTGSADRPSTMPAGSVRAAPSWPSSTTSSTAASRSAGG